MIICRMALIAAVWGLDRAVPGHSERPDGLHHAIARLRCPGSGTSLNSPSGGYRVGRVGLADLAASTAIRSVDLDDLQTLSGQMTGQAGAVGAGALNTDRDDIAVAGEPAKQLLIAHAAGGEGRVPEQATELVQRSDRVGVGVGVDPADDLALRGLGFCHGVAPFSR
jgi:hypothetical protein